MIGQLHSAQLAALDARLTALLVAPSPEVAFAAYLHRRLGTPLPANVAPAVELPPGAEERASEAPVLAIAGYALDRSPGALARGVWDAGFARLRKRDPLPADRAAFGYRPVEVVGVASGVRATEPEGGDATDWLRDVIDRARQRADTTWAQGLLAIAADLVGGQVDQSLARGEIDGLVLHEVAALYCAANLVPSLVEHEGPAFLQRLSSCLLEKWLTCGVETLDAAEGVAVRVAVQSTIARVVSGSAVTAAGFHSSLDLVERICRRFPRIAQPLANRQRSRDPLNIGDEYDVQDLLHALLRVHFDDVRPEEFTPSYAAKAARMDFLLKRERIVVEAKMTRAGLDGKRVADELIIDKERYRSHPDCDALVCVVYDPTGRVSNPAGLEADLSAEEPNFVTRVVVCPHS